MSQTVLRPDPQRQDADAVSTTLGQLQQLEHELQALRADDVAPPILPATASTNEWRVLAVVALVLGIGECVFLFGKHRLSKDVEHLQSFGQLAADFKNAPAVGPKILFLGNSLTRYGVDEATVAASFQTTAGVLPTSLKIVPDNTAVADWYYVYRNQFAVTERSPQMLVIGFEGRHLRDAPSRHPDRLAQYYCTWSDWPELCARDLPDVETRAAFVLEKCSAMVGNRDRVTRRALDELIPGYREGMDRINASLKSHGSSVATPEYQRLRKLIALAKEQHVAVVLAAMPVPERYEFDPELLAVVQETGVSLLDLRQVDGITREMFFDGLHMDASAGKLYSAALARELARLPREAPVGQQ